MAQKTKTKGKGFSRFLDFIGLVDSEEDDVFEEDEAPKSRTESRSSRTESRRSADTDRTRTYERPSRSSSRASDRDFGSDTYSSTRTGRSTRPSTRSGDDDEYWRGSWSTRDTRDSRESREERSSFRDSFRESSRESAREPQRESESNSRHQTVIFHLRRFEDCRDVILALLDRKSVLLNLDPLDEATAQRVIDAMGGAAFALGALISKASEKNYLITPNNVSVANGNVEPRRKAERYL